MSEIPFPDGFFFLCQGPSSSPPNEEGLQEEETEGPPLEAPSTSHSILESLSEEYDDSYQEDWSMCSDPLPPTPQEYNIIALDQPLTPVDFEFVVPEGMCCPDFNKEGPLSLYHDENNNLVMEDTPGTSQTDFHQVCFSGNMEWKGAFSPEKDYNGNYQPPSLPSDSSSLCSIESCEDSEGVQAVIDQYDCYPATYNQNRKFKTDMKHSRRHNVTRY